MLAPFKYFKNITERLLLLCTLHVLSLSAKILNNRAQN